MELLHTSLQMIAEEYSKQIEKELDTWKKEKKLEKLFKGDASLWTNNDEANWLGWLDVAAETKQIPLIKTLSKHLANLNITDVVVLGMGGSSLCPDTMAKTFGQIPNFPRLHILDSTDPDEIHHLESQINLPNTFFIVSSKSGTTLEPNIFNDYFYAKLQTLLGKKEVGDRFIAITDPNTPMVEKAKKDHFKEIFFGVPSIGGRYSALSNFGMVPAGLMGINLDEFLKYSIAMQQACAQYTRDDENPGLLLGVILGVYANNGKNKITFFTSPQIESLASWLEQLIAESTGKEGKGLIPIALEAIGTPNDYSHDRLFVYIRCETEENQAQDIAVDALEQAGFPVVTINFLNKMHLGAEFFRWEMATAVAGSIIGINPFNQPDVEESKKLALEMTSRYDQTEKLPEQKPFFTSDGISLFTDDNNLQELNKHLAGDPSLESYLRAHLQRLKVNDYFNISAFIDMSNENINLIQKFRILIRNNKKVATCLGFGPRFLHSTGQLYNGGPNSGVFLQITTDHKNDIPIPNHKYTFGTVITAQAQAYFTVLGKRSRRVLRVHIDKNLKDGLTQLNELIAKALS